MTRLMRRMKTITIGSSSAFVTQSATLTLTDDDATPTITLSVSPTSVSEGRREYDDYSNRYGGRGNDLRGRPIRAADSYRFGYRRRGGICAGDRQSRCPSRQGLPVAPPTFTLTPTDNQTDESDETITISSSSTLVSNSATLTLEDDDAGATIALSCESNVGERRGMGPPR